MANPLSNFRHLDAEVKAAGMFYANMVNDVIFSGTTFAMKAIAKKNGYKVSAPVQDKEKRQKADAALAILILHYGPGGLPPEIVYALALGQFVAAFKWEKDPEAQKELERKKQEAKNESTESNGVELAQEQAKGSTGTPDNNSSIAGTGEDSSSDYVPAPPRTTPAKKRRGRRKKEPAVPLGEGNDTETSKA